MKATALPSGAPAGATRAVIRRVADEVELVELRWGLCVADEAEATVLRFVRAEGRTFPSHRCLVPASEFLVVRGGKPCRASLEDGSCFYLAGVWRAGSRAWPESFAVLTLEANCEVSRYQPRQGGRPAQSAL